jgi:hypothetical protein
MWMQRHGAARAGGVPEQHVLGEALAADALDAGVRGGLLIAPGQALEFVERGHVPGGAQVVVLANHAVSVSRA